MTIESKSVFPRGWGGGARNVKQYHEGNLGLMEMSSNLIVAVVRWPQTYIKTHWRYILLYANYTPIKLIKNSILLQILTVRELREKKELEDREKRKME